MDMYGDILKRRIKEMGYTQNQFADETGVPFSTLKKYLANKSYYPIDLLKMFAEKLDCSYDYLMGFTISPDRDIQSVKDATRLSDEAIRRLQGFAHGYDTEGGNELSDALSRIIESETLIESIAMYLYPNEVLKVSMDAVADGLDFPDEVRKSMPMNADTVLVLGIIAELMQCKNNMNQ